MRTLAKDSRGDVGLTRGGGGSADQRAADQDVVVGGTAATAAFFAAYAGGIAILGELRGGEIRMLVRAVRPRSSPNADGAA